MRKYVHLRYNISMVVIVGNFVQEGSWLQNKGWQDYTGQVHTWPNLQNNRRVISKRNITKKHNFYLYYYCKVFSFFQKLLSIKEIPQIEFDPIAQISLNEQNQLIQYLRNTYKLITKIKVEYKKDQNNNTKIVRNCQYIAKYIKHIRWKIFFLNPLNKHTSKFC